MKLVVAAKLDDPDWGIIQSPFMRDSARTLDYRHKVTVGAGKMSYEQTMNLDIYGRSFEHTDRNDLVRG